MPSSASSKKRLRQNKVHRLRNRATKSVMRGMIKTVRTSIDSGDYEESTKAFQRATKKIDQAAGKNVIHANNAARIKSRLSKAIKALKS
ncbi:MAG: 30S ribosomal protein S20 [Planctomycetes bacterium]|nr:30S ribosomal protein S20 [Planctomycetota bacterium]